MIKPHKQGIKDFNDGKKQDECPYKNSNLLYEFLEWNRGYEEAKGYLEAFNEKIKED